MTVVKNVKKRPKGHRTGCRCPFCKSWKGSK